MTISVLELPAEKELQALLQPYVTRYGEFLICRYAYNQGGEVYAGFGWPDGWVVFCYFNGEWFVAEEEWQ